MNDATLELFYYIGQIEEQLELMMGKHKDRPDIPAPQILFELNDRIRGEIKSAYEVKL